MICPSLILCDHVYVDRNDGKVFILGSLNAILAPSFPHTRQVFIQFSVTEGQGDHVFEVRIEHQETGSPVGSIRSTPTCFEAPYVIHEEHFPIDLTLNLPGRYLVTLFANGRQIAQRPLNVFDSRGDVPNFMRVFERE